MLEDNKSYLKDLNDAQLNAVIKTDGPSMVIAGAGSGKTRVLTYKIVHLVNNGVDPFEILALTFTNKAAREMKLRISSMIGESESKNIWMGTFHSVFAKILRFEAHKIGFTSDFTIYDGTEMTMPAAYSAIKGGLNNLTRYLASYFGKYQIRINTISPGGIFDQQPESFVNNYNNKVPLKRMGTPQDIVSAVYYLLTDESSYVTGHNLVVDGGWSII